MINENKTVLAILIRVKYKTNKNLMAIRCLFKQTDILPTRFESL